MVTGHYQTRQSASSAADGQQKVPTRQTIGQGISVSRSTASRLRRLSGAAWRSWVLVALPNGARIWELRIHYIAGVQRQRLHLNPLPLRLGEGHSQDSDLSLKIGDAL